jgi:hypothetical protein
MIAQRYRPSEDFDMPRLHKAASPAQMLELRPEKVVCIPLLKIQVEAFENIRSMISQQTFNLKMFAMGFYS